MADSQHELLRSLEGNKHLRIFVLNPLPPLFLYPAVAVNRFVFYPYGSPTGFWSLKRFCQTCQPRTATRAMPVSLDASKKSPSSISADSTCGYSAVVPM